MKVLLDGKAVNVGELPTRTLGDLVRQLSNLPELESRVVQSVTVNGIELLDWEANSELELPRNAQLRVATQSVAELLASSLQSAKEYLPHLESAGGDAAALLHEGREGEAFDLIARLVEGLQWYTEVLDSLGILLPDQSHRATERLAALSSVLDDLVRAWEGRNYTLLADLLEYELSPEMERGREYVEELSQEIASESGNRK